MDFLLLFVFCTENSDCILKKSSYTTIIKLFLGQSEVRALPTRCEISTATVIAALTHTLSHKTSRLSRLNLINLKKVMRV